MKSFKSFSLEVKAARNQLAKLRKLLSKKTDLEERDDILPFFKKHSHAAALLGTYHPTIGRPDLLATELQLFGDFSCDLAVGNRRKGAFVLIEFEDGTKSSLFQRNQRSNHRWSSRLDCAFGQVIDWLWCFDDMRLTDKFTQLFGSRSPKLSFVIVIGRDRHLDEKLTKRLDWRAENVGVAGNKVLIRTYDSLLEDLTDRVDMGTILAKDGVR
jgi:hypothetical protein